MISVPRSKPISSMRAIIPFAGSVMTKVIDTHIINIAENTSYDNASTDARTLDLVIKQAEKIKRAQKPSLIVPSKPKNSK